MSLKAEILAFDHAQRKPAPQFAPTLARELLAFDRASARSYDVDGRLHVDVCNISKATVNPYYGREIPNAEALGLDPDKVYRLYRDPVELEKAAPTFMRLQLLDVHIAVDADDPKKEFIAGCIGSDVRFEDPYLKASLSVWVRSSIDEILKKKAAQLSCSYRYRADMTPGVTPGGLAFDGVMRDIVGNHVALVKEGRAGPDVFVNDSLPLEFGHTMKFPNIIAAVASVLPSLTESQKLALDAAFEAKATDAENDKETAMDSREEAMDSREEAMDAVEKDEVAKGDRKRARDERKAARDARAIDRKAKDSKRGKDSDPALEAEEKKLKGGEVKGNDGKIVDLTKYVTREDAAKLATDSADAAVARVQATATAVREVAPLVGPITVAMDSAEAVYRFALDHVKVAHKDVPASALSHIVAAEIRARKGGAAPAMDSVATEHTIDSIFGAK